MIIKNSGVRKDIKVSGIMFTLSPGNNVVNDSSFWITLVKKNPDLSIVTIQNAVKSESIQESVSTTKPPTLSHKNYDQGRVKKYYNKQPASTTQPPKINED